MKMNAKNYNSISRDFGSDIDMDTYTNNTTNTIIKKEKYGLFSANRLKMLTVLTMLVYSLFTFIGGVLITVALES